MNEKDILQLKKNLTMPTEVADALTKSCHASKKPFGHSTRFSRYRALCTAAAVLLCVCIAGTTSFAYNVYQDKQLVIFLESDLSQTEIDYIGQQLATLPDISSCRFISGDEAWETFKATYFTDDNGNEITDLTAPFTENPLADSFNYRVSVRLNADTQTVWEQISNLPGVRKIQTVREAEAEQNQ